MTLTGEQRSQRPPPMGTVTFLLTDIEGSTARWYEDHHAMNRDLAEHDAVLAAAIEAHSGFVFKHTGDGMLAAFDSAPAAADAAEEAVRSLALPIRAAIHTGAAVLRDGDYYGATLSRAARLLEAGDAGQILVSSTTAALLDTARVVELGTYHLRDLPEPERIFQLGTTEFRPLRVETRTVTNLRVPFNAFVGRQDVIEALCSHVTSQRLVTVRGTAGVGKTRLATEASHQLLGPAFDEVWLVDVGQLEDAETLPYELANVVGVRLDAQQPPEGQLAGGLQGRSALIIMDNCETHLAAVRSLVVPLLRECREIHVLATSRERLHAPEEQLFPLQSMSAQESYELFVERARLDQPDYEPSDRERRAIREVCRRLDGLPLAIELAAARVNVIDPVSLAGLLDDRFRLLTHGRAQRDRSQSSLRSALDWSYELLDEGERRLLDRLSVFSGSFDIAAAIAVADPGLDTLDMVERLTGLVEKSMVDTHDDEHLGSRYQLLETIRAFGTSHLEGADDLPVIRDRLVHHYATQATALTGRVFSPAEVTVHREVLADLANYRVATRWALAAKQTDALMALLCGLPAAAVFGSSEPWTWILRASEHTEVREHERWNELEGFLAMALLVRRGDLDAAVRTAKQSLADRPAGFAGIRAAELVLALEAVILGDVDEAARWASSMELGGDTPEEQVWRLTHGLISVELLVNADRLDEARAELEKLRHVVRQTRWPSGFGFLERAVGSLYIRTDRERALTHFELAASTGRMTGNFILESLAWRDALIARFDDVPLAQTAHDLRRLMLWRRRQLPADPGFFYGVAALTAVVMARSGRPDAALIVDAWLAGRGRAMFDFTLDQYDRTIAEAKEQAGPILDPLAPTTNIEVVGYMLDTLAAIEKDAAA